MVWSLNGAAYEMRPNLCTPRRSMLCARLQFGGLQRDSLRGTQRKTNTAGVPALRRPSDTSGRSFLGTPGGGSASQAMPAADAPEQEITVKELFAGYDTQLEMGVLGCEARRRVHEIKRMV